MAALQALVMRGLSDRTERHWGIPLLFVTGTGDDPRPRMRVDPGDTAFYESRQFSVSHEFTLASGTSAWLSFSVPVDIIVKKRKLTMLQGSARACISTGGTSSAPWTEKSPFRVNSMASRPAYTRKVTVSQGGNITGSTEQSPPLLAETGNGQAVSVYATADEYGLAPAMYYLEIRNTGTGQARGLYESVWEETMPRSPLIF